MTSHRLRLQERLGSGAAVRRRVCVVLVAALACLVWPPALALPQQVSFDQLFRAYEAGDHGIVARRVRTIGDFDWIERELPRARNAWRRDWRPVHAVFMLDLATAPIDHGWRYLVADLVAFARTFVTGRGAPGVDPELDAFEIAWHTAMLSALLTRLDTRGIDDYLRSLEDRLTPTPLADRPTLVAPHVLLIQATAHEQVTTPDTIAARRGARTASLLIGRPDSQTRTHAENALQLFDHAAAFEGLAAEARVRRGFLLHRLGEHAAALESLDAADGRGGDRTVRYWRELFRGRVLEALDRRADAARAYEEAAAQWPEAQSPAIALTALHVRGGRRDDALRWTAALRALPADAYDPWWDYWYGDGRFFGRRRAALRAAVR